MSGDLTVNTFSITDYAAESGYIIPEIWSRKIEEFAKSKLVVTPLGRTDMSLFKKPGDQLNIAVDSELTAAALNENTKVGMSAISYSQVTVTPTEYGVGVSVTRKLLNRSFNDVLNDQAKIMGYALAKKKEQTIINMLVSGAGSTVTANDTAVASMTDADTLDEADIAKARNKLRRQDEDAKYLVIHPDCELSIIKAPNSTFTDASVYGSREVVLEGEIGKYLGLKVLVSTNIPQNSTNTSCRDNLVLAPDAFVYVPKMPVTFDLDYDVETREFKMVAVEEWGASVLKSSRICVLTAWAEA